jgi:hypothetical protein
MSGGSSWGPGWTRSLGDVSVFMVLPASASNWSQIAAIAGVFEDFANLQ